MTVKPNYKVISLDMPIDKLEVAVRHNITKTVESYEEMATTLDYLENKK